MQIDKPLYMQKPLYVDLRNQIAVSVVAAGKLDFEDVVRRAAGGPKVGRTWPEYPHTLGWDSPEKMCQILKRDSKLTSFLNLNQVKLGLEKFQLQGLTLERFLEDLNISEILEGVRPSGETEAGIGLDALISEIKRSNDFRTSLNSFLRDSTEAGGLGLPARENSVSIVWIPELSFYRGFKIAKLSRATLFRAMGQLLVYKQKWEFQVEEMIECLENTTYNNEPDLGEARRSQVNSKHRLQSDQEYGEEIRTSHGSLELKAGSADSGAAKDYHLVDTIDPLQDKRVTSTQFDKSSELKLKEEVIQFEELPERRSIFNLNDPHYLVSKNLLTKNVRLQLLWQR